MSMRSPHIVSGHCAISTSSEVVAAGAAGATVAIRTAEADTAGERHVAPTRPPAVAAAIVAMHTAANIVRSRPVVLQTRALPIGRLMTQSICWYLSPAAPCASKLLGHKSDRLVPQYMLLPYCLLISLVICLVSPDIKSDFNWASLL